MVSNESILLDQAHKSWRKSAPSGLSDDKYFDLFAIEQVLKNLQLSADDLLKGCVGASDDGGIDGIFTLLNEEIIDTDSPTKSVQSAPKLSLSLHQAKRTESFEEVAFDRLHSSLEDLLDLKVLESKLRKLFNPQVVDRIQIFRKTYEDLLGKHVVPDVQFYYLTRGDTSAINSKVGIKAEKLKAKIKALLPTASAEVHFLGAKELLQLTRQPPTYNLKLRFHGAQISEDDGYVMLAHLNDYFDFIKEPTGDLRKYIFEWNVRDYQGNVAVNRDIRNTLDETSSPPFWWLNNGITIVSSQASSANNVIAMDDVQIVNGLQTSMEIHRYLTANPGGGGDRSLLIRVVVTKDSVVRDKIIKGTNFQTRVSDASLRATDDIQRNIEQYFLGKGWFYDRRKNYYKNQGEPADRIVGMGFLAQAVMALGLGEPNSSRARPTTLIVKNSDYNRLFHPNVDLYTYLWCANLMRRIEVTLRKSTKKHLDAERWELRFHVAMWLVAKRKKHWVRKVVHLQNLTGTTFSERQIQLASTELAKFLQIYPRYGADTIDQIAKSREFIEFLFAKKFNQQIAWKKSA